jgi:hypothetical protein
MVGITHEVVCYVLHVMYSIILVDILNIYIRPYT